MKTLLQLVDPAAVFGGTVIVFLGGNMYGTGDKAGLFLACLGGVLIGWGSNFLSKA